MGLVFVTRTREPEADEVESRAPLARINYGGVYFFLYPFILRLRDQTGELIDPQQSAFFAGPALDRLAIFLAESQALASAQPDTWEQRVATRAGAGDVVYQSTSRSDLLALLGILAAALELAREQHMGVMFWGE